MGKHPSEHAKLTVRWQRRIRNVRRRIYGWMAAGATAIVLRVPFSVLLPASRIVAQPLLRLAFWRKARRNLVRTFPDLTPQEQRTILGQVFRGTASLGAEWMGFAQSGIPFLDRYVEDGAGRAQLNAFEKEWPGGWIGLTGHIGNWEVAAQWFCHVGLRESAGVIAKRQPNPHLNRVIARLRGRHGMGTLYRDDPPGKLIRLLRARRSFGTAADQDTPSVAGVFIDFLGRPAYTPVGPARLALAANVPMVVGAALRRGDGFVMQINPPIFPDRTRPRNEEVLRLTQEWSRQIEQIIRDHPDQWPWFHDRWKTTPESLAAKSRRTLELGGEPGRTPASGRQTG